MKEYQLTDDERSTYSNEVYGAIIGYLEDLEHRDVYRGNGHHLAQRLTKLIMPAIARANFLVDRTIKWHVTQAFNEAKQALDAKFPSEPTFLDYAEYHEALANLGREHGMNEDYIKGQLIAAVEYRAMGEGQ